MGKSAWATPLSDENLQQIVVNDLEGDIALLFKYVERMPSHQLVEVEKMMSRGLAAVREALGLVGEQGDDAGEGG